MLLVDVNAGFGDGCTPIADPEEGGENDNRPDKRFDAFYSLE